MFIPYYRDITNSVALAQAQKNLSAIQVLMNTSTCRRIKLLQHFDANAESKIKGTPKCCDNCRRGTGDVQDWVEVIYYKIKKIQTASKLDDGSGFVEFDV